MFRESHLPGGQRLRRPHRGRHPRWNRRLPAQRAKKPNSRPKKSGSQKKSCSEEERRKEEEAEEQKKQGGGAGGSGSGGNASSTGGSSTSTTPAATGSRRQPSKRTGRRQSQRSGGFSHASSKTTIKLSALALTSNALLSLRSVRPKIRAVGFAFTLSAAARVHATLAKLVRVLRARALGAHAGQPHLHRNQRTQSPALDKPGRAAPRPLSPDAHTAERRRAVDRFPDWVVPANRAAGARPLLVLGVSPG